MKILIFHELTMYENAAGRQKIMPNSALYRITFLQLLSFILIFFPAAGYSAENRINYSANTKESWTFFLSGAYAHQFSADLDDGGSFSMDRFFIQGGTTYSPARRRSISLAAGYGIDKYDFSRENFFSGNQPWQDVHSLHLSLPVRWEMNPDWSVIVVPAMRMTAEDGTNWSSAVNGGGFAGFTYRFHDRLVIGPGIGVFSQLEETASVFPVVLVSWSITDQLSLNTGNGFGATRGPGLFLQWKPSVRWEFQVGGRYDTLRFRLGDDGPAPEGIGENTSYPIIFGTTYNYNSNIRISLLAGLEVGGELRLENTNGTLLAKDDYDPAGFMGLMLRFRQ